MVWPAAESNTGQGQQFSNRELGYTDAIQVYRHIFTLTSSGEKEAKATRSGNACIHGMTHVTRASIAYVATQVYFLSSSLFLTITNFLPG